MHATQAATPKAKVALLTGAGKAALLNFETYAYDSVNGSQVFNISSDVTDHGDHTMVTLSFPAKPAIYYDPTMETNVDPTTAGYNTTDTLVLTDVQVTNGSESNAADSSRFSYLSAVAAGLLLLAQLL